MWRRGRRSRIILLHKFRTASDKLGTKLGAERKRRVGQEGRKGRSREEEEGGTGREKG